LPLRERLMQEGIPLNVTAIFTLEQVRAAVDALEGGAPGRVAESLIPVRSLCR
jgi:transaldolase